jgi:hypothetical protein
MQSLAPDIEIAVRPGEPVKKGNADSAVPQRVVVKEASIERDLVSSAGANYVRVPTTDHTRPLDDAVDRFILAVRALPENAGRIFTAKLGLDERPRSWCFTACCEMRLTYRSRTLCAVRNCWEQLRCAASSWAWELEGAVYGRPDRICPRIL